MKRLSKIPPAKRLMLLSLDYLTKKRQIDKIKTKEIYEYAGLSANTFYYHFKDKYDCASLLVKYYETLLHEEYTGPVEDYYDYISKGSYIINHYLAETEKSGLDLLKYCYERTFEEIPATVSFWHDHSHIILNILSSEAQNSPQFEHKEAWSCCFMLLLDYVPDLSDMQRHYLAHLVSESFYEFWFKCMPLCWDNPEEMESASNLFKQTFFALYSIIPNLISK